MKKVTKSVGDFIVYADGTASISQRKLADLLGVKESTLMMHISREHKNLNTANGLSPELMKSVSTYFAYKSKVATDQAKDLLDQLIDAGAKAFIYYHAGVQLMDSRELVNSLAHELEEIELGTQERSQGNKLVQQGNKRIKNAKASYRVIKQNNPALLSN